ncbi:transcriptional regulatory protein RtcR [Methylomagnum ishizawai]|uniref:Transcriptional regulatory protein RtcR n=1 Tax=Methylomagnum ishizawai TaxID=1760988 RepID=A0A1Y6CZ87_9GAMM|nr:RNA repair transcriptional activator RtcR [Methylomagnum ishizawai]SMF95651.1 transcriptional regulatory protein RtcR [Methylomagnum ishizawai]
MKNLVVIGFIGTQLDAGRAAGRWEKWRPSVALTQREDLEVHRFELLYTPRHLSLVEQIVADIAAVSPETLVRPVALDIADPWDFGEVYAALFDFASGYAFDTGNEDYWIHITTGTHVAQICLFLMAEARYLPGPLLQTSPPKRQGVGEIGGYVLIDLDLSKYDAIAQRFARAQQDAIALLKSGIATRNPHFNRVITEIEQVAVRSKAPMLLMGPTGAGKSFLARRVFELKKARRQVAGGFVEVNCATLRGDGAASALFGHVKGAFTGAVAERGGLLRAADGGVLFLDEIGELGQDEQAMLLKAIEDKTFYPVGGDREVGSDFQLIAGTNRDLRREVLAGRFREDLFARINLWTYELPGLARRPEDIEPNLDFFLARHSAELGHRVRFSAEARRKYLAFAQSPAAKWSGNFRDLGASVMRLATLAEGGRIAESLVETEIARLRALWEPVAEGGRAGCLLTPEAWADLDRFDQLQLEAVIGVCREAASLSEAGRRLFAVSRNQRASPNDADRLRKYLARFGLDWRAVKTGAT